MQPGLGSLHLVFAKEHNRIVTKLAEVQPQWSQEKLFNEARKIIGALMQHITYSDYFISKYSLSRIYYLFINLYDKEKVVYIKRYLVRSAVIKTCTGKKLFAN